MPYSIKPSTLLPKPENPKPSTLLLKPENQETRQDKLDAVGKALDAFSVV